MKFQDNGGFVGGQCGKIFEEGELVYHCKQCATDPTCVLCARCYRDVDHLDHDVTFYRSGAGGCCDCGDPEAIDSKFFCARHGTFHGSTTKQTSSCAVENKNLIAIFSFMGTYILKCSDAFERLRPLSSQGGGELRLYNDDVHSFEEVRGFFERKCWKEF